MSFERAKNYGLRKIGLAVVVAAILLPTGMCLAQNSRGDLPDYYPHDFAGMGCIDRITADSVVIDDRLFTLSPFATFHTLKAQSALRSQFRQGVRVGFIQGAHKEIESLWYLDKCK